MSAAATQYAMEIANRNIEGEVVGSLIASQTLLNEAAENDYQIPDFTVSEPSILGRRPKEITMETQDGEKYCIDVTYTIFGNLKEINIDKECDGSVDSKFVNRRNFFGGSEVFDYYAKADGELTATGIPHNGGFLNPQIHKLEFQKPDGKPLGTIEIENSFWVAPEIFHVKKDGSEVATGQVKKGFWGAVQRFGEKQQP